MRHLSIKQQLGILVAFAFVLSVCIGIFQVRSVREVSDGLAGTIESSEVLRNHMEADMMHDALRADVVSALYDSGKGGAGKKDVEDGLKEHSDHFKEMIAANDKLHLSANTKKALEAVKPSLASYIAAADKITSEAYSNHQQAESEFPKFIESFEDLEGKMASLSDTIQKDSSIETNKAKSDSSKNMFVSLIAVSAMGLFAVVALWILGSRIAKRAEKVKNAAKELESSVIDPLTEALHKLADGNLNYHPTIKSLDVSDGSSDEISQAFASIAKRTEQMVEAYDNARVGLSSAISKVAVGAEKLAYASQSMKEAVQLTAQTSSEIAQGSDSLAEVTSSTAQSIEKLYSSIEIAARGSEKQLDTVDESFRSLNTANLTLEEVNRNSADMAENAKKGVDAVSKVTRAMESISDQTSQSLLVVQALKTQSQKIGSIVNTIEDVAAQTNLLSLNASIEAARAGEHGRGFTVVANEVRKLSQEASDAAKEIGLLISDVTKAVNEVVTCVEQMQTAVKQGSTQTLETGSVLDAIVDSITSTVNQIHAVSYEAEVTSKKIATLQEIATEGNAISSEMKEIAMNVTQSANSSASFGEESAACAEELKASTNQLAIAADELESISAELRATAAQFTTSEVGHLRLAS